MRAKALVTAIIGLLAAFVFSHPVLAQVAPALPAPTQPGAPGGALTRALGDVSGNGAPLSLSLQILILMMTSFTRIIIVLSLLRQALGLAQTPPNQVLVGLALFLSLFVMRPTIDAVTQQAYTPYGAGQITIEEAIGRSGKIFHTFMAKQTRESDLRMFTGLADAPDYQNIDEVPFTILLPAFVTSELKTAFQIGFMIFLPFLIIDLVVASTLMSLGMMMLSPTIISMPFKLLLFVMVDGWALTMGSLAGSFAT